MTDTKINTYFVSEKISKIRWVPEQLKESERFLTGTWDMPSNFVRVWRLHQNQYADDYNDIVPKSSDKVCFPGDVTGLEFVTDDTAVVSCSDGHITVLKVHRAVEEDILKEFGRSLLLHRFDSDGRAAPCTAISVYGKDVATVGEDGRLNVIDTTALNVVRRTIDADSCALTAVSYVNPQEVLTANRMGVIRMFDIRSEDAKSTADFMISCEDEKSSNFVSCLASHPMQPHVILAGSEEGSITVWDLRQLGYAASYLSAHTSAITELAFQRNDPTRLFSAAECGELWLWAQHSSLAVSNELETQKIENVNPWLNGERTKNRMSVTSLMSDMRKSINSFDSHGSKIVCGGDSEAVYFIDNML